MKSKFIKVLSLLALGAATQANAADVIVHRHMAPVVVVKPVGSFSWTGLYLGAQGSFQWAKHDVNTGATNFSSFSLKKDGAGAGLLAGFNSNMMSGAVVGVETDILWNTIKGGYNYSVTPTATLPTELKAVRGNFKEKWSGSTRLRVGFAQGKLLPFLAGGVAYTNLLLRDVYFTPGSPAVEVPIAAHYENLIGWTAGAGVDCAVTDNLLMRLEYRYNDLGKKTIAFDGFSTAFHYGLKYRTHDVRVGVAYKF
ncbi:MAG: porin family protein [Alphaproteobacteria bacterium]|nr:porin family protein [Alphaproteobacteria bacterium]